MIHTDPWATESPTPADHNQTDAQRFQAYVERIDAIQSERAEMAEAIKEVYAEAKSAGFDVKLMRKALSLRKLSADDRQRVDMYVRAAEGEQLALL